MARTEARIYADLWDDADFLALEASAQRMYVYLLSQRDLTHCGSVALRVRRWADNLRAAVAAIEGDLAQLAKARFVVVDFEREELLVRTHIRNDRVYKQPNLLRAARSALAAVTSPLLRAALAVELVRLRDDPAAVMPGGSREPLAGMIADLADAIEQPATDPSGDGSGEPFADGQANGPGVRGKGSGGHLKVVPPQGSSSRRRSRADAAEQVRPEVEELCTYLADRVEQNGSRRPTITKGWKDAARLMLDRDGRTVEQIRAAIDWCQGDEFWRANVLSMTTLRKQYDRLRLAAARQRAPAREATTDVRMRQVDAALAEVLGEGGDP
ncbi:hypothetical protein [Glycomyces sp. NPDC048151]|uniref:hypothetical protein n=1 Tax=Glycomyces sp. NPDC048151 TaxID=3364002 RepID=UPI0037205F48